MVYLYHSIFRIKNDEMGIYLFYKLQNAKKCQTALCFLIFVFWPYLFQSSFMYKIDSTKEKIGFRRKKYHPTPVFFFSLRRTRNRNNDDHFEPEQEGD